MGNTRNLGDLLNTDSTIATADVADGGITTAKLADDAVTQAKIGADAVGTTELANDVAISTSGAITTTGAFTSVGIDDNADATTITLDANEDITASNGMYVSGDLTSLTVDKGGIDRSGNTTRIISGRSGGNYADMSINIAGVGGINRQVYVDYQGNMTLDNGNLTIGTAGKGIDFSAVTHATGKTSELLDAYEEGTWTPTYRTADGSSITVNTYNRQHGRYTRIGRNVFCRFAIGTTSVTFNNGQVDHNSNHRVQMDGLPFTASSDSINGGGCSAVFSSMGSVTTGVGFLINNNSTIISLRNMGDTSSYNGNFIDDIYTAQMRNHSSGEGNMLTGQFFYQTE